MNIKFRVWCKDFNGWEKDTVLLAPNGQKFHLGRNGKMIPIKPENHIVMMWTGLCDRQGKEIYEGDIIKIDNGKANEVHRNWVDNPIQIVESFNIKFPQNFWIMHPYIEVIGNIFENKNLIENNVKK